MWLTLLSLEYISGSKWTKRVELTIFNLEFTLWIPSRLGYLFKFGHIGWIFRVKFLSEKFRWGRKEAEDESIKD